MSLSSAGQSQPQRRVIMIPSFAGQSIIQTDPTTSAPHDHQGQQQSSNNPIPCSGGL